MGLAMLYRVNWPGRPYFLAGRQRLAAVMSLIWQLPPVLCSWLPGSLALFSAVSKW